MLRTNVTSEKSAKKIKKANKKITQAPRTRSSARSFFRAESVHVPISFFCERVATLIVAYYVISLLLISGSFDHIKIFGW